MTRVKVLKHENVEFRHYSKKIEREIKDFVQDKRVLQMSQSFNPFGMYTTIIYDVE